MTRGWTDFIAAVARTPEQAEAERSRPTCILCRRDGVELIDGYCPGCIEWASKIVVTVDELQPKGRALS